MPKTQLIEVLVKGIGANVDGIAWFNIREFDGDIFNGHGRIAIDVAFNAYGKDVLVAQKRPGNGPSAE